MDYRFQKPIPSKLEPIPENQRAHIAHLEKPLYSYNKA